MRNPVAPDPRLVGQVVAPLLLALVVTGCSTPSGSTAEEPAPTTASAAGSTPPASESPPSETPSSSPSPSASAGKPPYAATVRRIGPELRARMQQSHRAGCPVDLQDLRYLRLRHIGFDGTARTGELVVHKDHATGIVGVFQRLYAARWPIRRMRLVDEYGGDDDASMAADNTSAYNCRQVAGAARWSEHAYGRAIDLNPVENPYVQSGSVDPPGGRRFAAIDRSRSASPPQGVIRDGDVVVEAFSSIGWEWGGDWASAKDYQHFSATGS